MILELEAKNAQLKHQIQNLDRAEAEAEQKVEAIVAALEIDPTAVNLEAGQLKLIVEAVVKQAKEVNDVK